MFKPQVLLLGAASAARYTALALRQVARRSAPIAPVAPASQRNWANRPGLGIMYQIETRPGWRWDRDYDAFNASLRDASGHFAFNGPHCRIDDWVDLSRDVGVDYHSFEAKWHDGICWFETASTDWKTPVDYCARFADASRAAGIPFLYYYSAVFDHNPQFDAIQPEPHTTPSLIGNDAGYRQYLLGHYREIMSRYRPDGMWFDWYWADASTPFTLEHFREQHPDTPVFYNLSNLFPSSFGKVPVTSSEAHGYDGPWVTLRKEDALRVPVLTSAVKWSNSCRMLFDHRWELISPAGRWWQDQRLREDPLELLRMTAMVLACGGKLGIGATAQMDGSLFPDQVTQLRMLGAWYKPRRALFTDATPLRYTGMRVPGVKIAGDGFDTVASALDDSVLLHLVNRSGVPRDLSLVLDAREWGRFRQAELLPQGKSIPLHREDGRIHISLGRNDVDEVDTIIRLRA
ncbi:MAG: alpha-L-fucosidase [Gammaproteobacteria bacterium]